MEAEPQPQDQIKAVVLVEVEQVFMHRLLKKEKSLFTSGTLKIARLENNKAQPVHFININSFYYGIQPNIHFIKINYTDTVAYVFPHFQNGLSAISIAPIPELVQGLDTILSQVARLVDPKTAMQSPELKALIDLHYPQLQKDQIYYPDNIKKYIAEAGHFFNKAFTTIGGYLKTGVTKAGNYIDSKITEGEPTQFSDTTKERWQKLKEGAGSIINVSSEYAGKILNPIMTKTKEYTNDLQEKINHSENQTIKYFKELTKVSGQAIGEAFDGLVKGGSEVTKELGAQGKKIITKKYGDEVIKTIAGQKQEEKIEKPAGEKEGQKKEEKVEAQQSSVRLNESAQNLYPSVQK